MKNNIRLEAATNRDACSNNVPNLIKGALFYGLGRTIILAVPTVLHWDAKEIPGP